MDGQSWQTTMDGHRTEYNRLVEETGKLARSIQDQSDKKVVSEQDELTHRQALMDKAYKALVVFVEDLLKYTDAGAEIGIDGVPSLLVVVECFKALADYCELVIDKEGLEAVEATQEIGEDGQILEQINKLKTHFKSDMNGLDGAISNAEEYFNTSHDHHMQARDAVSRAEDRRNEFFYSVFGDGDIDRAVDECRVNESSWHSRADEAWNDWDKLRTLRSELQPLLGDLDRLVQELEKMAEEARSSYSVIGEDRKLDNECWIATRTLQYHVTTTTEYTSQDDALRHIIKLLHTTNKTIDSDSNVALYKQRMEERIREQLGADKAAALAREKTYLLMPEDVDF